MQHHTAHSNTHFLRAGLLGMSVVVVAAAVAASAERSDRATDASHRALATRPNDAAAPGFDGAALLRIERSVPQRFVRVLGRELMSADNNPLGTIQDVAFDSRSGRLALAVVASGGTLGVGEHLRAVPFKAIETAAGGAGPLRTDLKSGEWDSLPLIDPNAYNKGRIDRFALGGGRDGTAKRELFDAFEINEDRTDFAARLMLATRLKDKTVSVDGREVAAVEDVLADFGPRRALLLLDADADFAGGSSRFLASVKVLQVSGAGLPDTIAAGLTRSDFTRAPRAGDGTAAHRDDTTGGNQTPVSSAVSALSTGSSATVGSEGPEPAAEKQRR